MKSLNNMQHPWPLRKKPSRLMLAIKRQWADQGDREEALTTLAVIAVFIIVLVIFFLSFPFAAEHELDHGRRVVAESRGE